jgi:CHAD domain-containing protein
MAHAGVTGSPTMAFSFDPRRPVTRETRRIFAEELQLATGELLDPELDPDGVVHSVRKRLKRIRALVRLVGPSGADGFKEANRSLRDAGRELSELRDAHICLATLDAVRLHRGPDLGSRERKDLGGLEQELAKRLEACREGSHYVPARNRAAQLIAPVLAWSQQIRLGRTGFAALAPGFRTSYAKGRTAMKEALAGGEPEAFHEWRKRVKDHWHHLELLAPAHPQAMNRRADRVHALSDVLGAYQDLAVLETAAATPAGKAKAAERRARDLLARLVGQERERLGLEATQLGKPLYRRSPESMTGAVQGFWNRGTAS